MCRGLTRLDIVLPCNYQTIECASSLERVHVVVRIIAVQLSSLICLVYNFTPFYLSSGVASTYHARQPRHNDQPSAHELFLRAPMHISTLSICRGCEAFYAVGGGMSSHFPIQHTSLSIPAR